MIPSYIAHFDCSRIEDPHYLKDHVQEMREIISSFDLTFDLYNMTEASVILHDVGKKSKRFQFYVQECNEKRGSVQHAKGGAYALWKNSNWSTINMPKKVLINYVQHIVACHHTGLTNHDKNLMDRIKDLPNELKGIEVLAAQEVEEAFHLLDESPLIKLIERFGDKQLNLYLATLLRFAMSALVDADYLSTEAYFSKQIVNKRQYDAPSFSEFQKKLDKYMTETFHNKEGKLDQLKYQVQSQAKAVAKQEASFFTLHAPTGTGKTLAALQFALHHARKHGKKRIITALPLINLTEETSSIYKEIFDKDHVIEDHSNMPFTDSDDERIRLAAENYNRPFVVSTTIGLFESLFHHRPMKLRKLHRLANSIIILDEYHKLPHHVLEPIFQQLDVLQTYFNVTVLLMSATPFPFFESRRIAEMKLVNNPVEITDYYQLYRHIPPRVKYQWLPNQLTLNEAAHKIAEETAVLVIVNTRKEAQQLHQLLLQKSHHFEHVYHLSTTMCGDHREKVINEIKNKRKPTNPRPIAVISTSIMEAGIDISFPVVYRVLAPIEAIVQAAGRCNRYGEEVKGRLIIFENKDMQIMDPSFEAGIKQTRNLLQQKGVESFAEPSSFVSYYQRMLSSANLNEYDIVNSNCLEIKRISDSFRMIEDNRISVICKEYPGFKLDWINEMKSPEWRRKIQPYTVSVSSPQQYEEINHIKFLTGGYDPTYGVLLS